MLLKIKIYFTRECFKKTHSTVKLYEKTSIIKTNPLGENGLWSYYSLVRIQIEVLTLASIKKFRNSLTPI